ncbi:MAG: acyl carrier protein [Oscillospiraceae bacterium]|nr:acyl carrier protein [Oscillospiraceae bacterium]
MDKIIEILSDLHEDVDFTTCDTLIDDKILDSFDIITVITEINSEFDVAIPADRIVPENFNSAQALAALVEELEEI